MIEIPLDDKPGRYVFVIRIDRDSAPRPVFVQVTARFSKETRNIFWAPIRMPGSTRQATRDELYALFTESRPVETPDTQWDFNRPDIPRSKDGTNPHPDVDLVMLSGVRVPVGPAAWGRPLSERAIEELATKLDHSALPQVLGRLARRSTTDDVELSIPKGRATGLTSQLWSGALRQAICFRSRRLPGSKCQDIMDIPMLGH
jgi:hypothetical protein